MSHYQSICDMLADYSTRYETSFSEDEITILFLEQTEWYSNFSLGEMISMIDQIQPGHIAICSRWKDLEKAIIDRARHVLVRHLAEFLKRKQ